jgi:hypothetical protein
VPAKPVERREPCGWYCRLAQSQLTLSAPSSSAPDSTIDRNRRSLHEMIISFLDKSMAAAYLSRAYGQGKILRIVTPSA